LTERADVENSYCRIAEDGCVGQPDGLSSPLGSPIVVVFWWTVVFLNGDDICREGVKKCEGVRSFDVTLHTSVTMVIVAVVLFIREEGGSH